MGSVKYSKDSEITGVQFNKTAYMCFIDPTQPSNRVRLTDVLTLLKKGTFTPI